MPRTPSSLPRHVAGGPADDREAHRPDTRTHDDHAASPRRSRAGEPRHARWHPETARHWWSDLRVMGPAAVTLLALGLRLWRLGWPDTLVFDETYYVKDAWSLGARGSEAQWSDDPNPTFESGDWSSFLPGEGSFVVHPPLGKWLIWLGMNADVGQSWAWRLSAALAGTLTVLLVCLLALRLFRSGWWATLAGGLLAIDGLAISMSRTGLLDVFIGLFVTAAAGAIVLDRERHRRRLVATGGAIDWRRPWLLTAAVLLGCATAVKWSGLWFALAFGLFTVVDDLAARHVLRRDATGAARPPARVRLWPLRGGLQGLVNAAIMAPTVLVVYLASWTGWLVTQDGWGRHWADDNPVSGVAALVPGPLRSLWHYHVVAYRFHTTLDAPHPWASSPLTWPLMLKPTLFYRTITAYGEDGCTDPSGCVATVSSIANPLIWWAAGLATLVVLGWLAWRRDWRAGLIITGVAGGWLPWLLYLNRTVFFFYAVAWEPFLVLALVAALRLLEPDGADDSARALRRRRWTRPATVAFVAVAVLLSAWFYPLWTGETIARDVWALHAWLPSSWL